MDLKLLSTNGRDIAEVISTDVVINDVRDGLDLMANVDHQGARRIILCEENLNPAFFELRTGLAGDIVQKFANYRMKLAIVGDFTKYNSRSLQAFILESNKGDLLFFVPDRETAIARLTRSKTV